MPTWPADVPYALERNDYREQLGDELLRSDLPGPEKERRPARQGAPGSLGGTILMTLAEYDMLEEWFTDDLGGGTLSFDMPRQGASDPAADRITAIFQEPPELAGVSDDLWAVRVDLNSLDV